MKIRADEAITIGDVEFIGEIQAADYINQLRYERLMAKAAFFAGEAPNYGFYSSYYERCTRIAEAYEARAKRIKEGK